MVPEKGLENVRKLIVIGGVVFGGGSSEKCSTSESAPYGAYVEYGGFTNFTVKGYEVKFPKETDINKYCRDSK